MATAKERQVTIPIRVTVPESAMESMVRGRETPEEAVQRNAQALLAQSIGGGVMLSGTDISAMEQITGVQVQTGADAIAAINQGAPLKDGKHRFTVTIDQALIAPIQQYCEVAGVAPDDLVSQVWSLCVTEGLLLSLQPLGGSFHASMEDRFWMDEFMGKRIYTLADVSQKVRTALQPVEV